jgi:hypothetical protein
MLVRHEYLRFMIHMRVTKNTILVWFALTTSKWEKIFLGIFLSAVEIKFYISEYSAVEMT